MPRAHGGQRPPLHVGAGGEVVPEGGGALQRLRQLAGVEAGVAEAGLHAGDRRHLVGCFRPPFRQPQHRAALPDRLQHRLGLLAARPRLAPANAEDDHLAEVIDQGAEDPHPLEVAPDPARQPDSSASRT